MDIEQYSPAALERQITAIVERAVERALAARTEPTHLTIAEAAQRLRCSERQVWRLISLRQLRRRIVAGRAMVERTELNRYLADAV